MIKDLLTPNIAYASVDSFISNVNRLILNPIIIFLFALAVVLFLFGVFQFVWNQDNEEKKTTGKNHMIWGIVGMVIMMGVFSILDLIIATFNIDGVDVRQGTVDTSSWPSI